MIATHTNTINAANTLGACLLGEGRMDEARVVLQRALTGTDTNTGMAGKLLRVAVQINLAHVATAAGDWSEAGRLLAQIRAHGAKLLKMDTDAEGEVALIDGQVSASRGDDAAARRLLEQGIELLGRKNPQDYWLIRIGLRALAKLPDAPPQRAAVISAD